MVYDEGGTAHELTIYFDPVTEENNVANPVTGWDDAERIYEFVVTMKPEEDYRKFGTDNQEVTDASRGLLMMGTIAFNKDGTMKDMSAYVPTDPNAALGADYDLKNLNNWSLAPISSNGYPMLAPNFSGIDGRSSVYMPGSNTVVNPDVLPNTIEVNLGMRTKDTDWNVGAGGRLASGIGLNRTNLSGLGLQGERNAQATTNYGDTSSTPVAPYQDGYSFGFLSRVTVDQNGILSGVYSNGQTLQLYQITLYDFMAEQGLYHEGGNLYSETLASGQPSSAAANSSGFGQIASNSLEISNVDLAREFVNMITTQRGFQANSKTITTVDTMLETVISMKR